MLKIKRVPGGVSIRLLCFDFFLTRNQSSKADYVLFDRYKSMEYFPGESKNLLLYKDSLKETDMDWTDNIYKQLRVLSFLQLVRIASNNNPSGAFLELGVWKGLSALMIAKILRDELSSKQSILLVDSFEGGLADKTIEDKNLIFEQSMAQVEKEKMQFSSQKADVASVLAKYSGVEIIEGWVPDVLDEIGSSETFAFIHFDMDLFQPTVAALEILWSRVLPKGILVFDDYNSTQFPGVTEAVRDFVKNRRGEIDLFFEVPFGSAWILKK